MDTFIPKPKISKVYAEIVNRRNECIYDLLISCGLRINELKRINISDVNLDNCTLKIRGMGNNEWTVFIPIETACLLEVIIGNRDDKEPLFVNRYNSRISDTHLGRICKLDKYEQVP
ncbi:tyrosine-type recombinase/integrase [Desulfosporosinus sp. I2]|uniref:tyrosine-type recombinase/integrase n=1 Tax=Desulfosporosinus sp. I2 TaxID=1617025 RepID=UPI0005EDA9B2|nr:tyrosine-type recombinase/integrase [Desulfosporosinus sp. I2]